MALPRPIKTTLILGQDINSNVTFKLPWSPTGARVNLQAGVAQSTTVPANMTSAFFSYEPGTKVWVNPNGTATLPTNSWAASGQKQNPLVRDVEGGMVLSMISETDAEVGVEYFEGGT